MGVPMVKPMPKPMMIRQRITLNHVGFSHVMNAKYSAPNAENSRPPPSTTFTPKRSIRRPEIGAPTPENRASTMTR